MLPIGLAATEPAALGASVVECWDAFLAVVESADLDRPSRLPGWTGHDLCVHLGSWPEHRVVDALLESAAEQASGPHHDADATNARVVALYRDAPHDEVIESLRRARDDAATFFASEHPLAVASAASPLGPLPVSTVLHAACYELAVHGLDLAPCGADAPAAGLLDRGLAALMDVTGALAARHDVDITVTAQTPDGGWRFESDSSGWRTERVADGAFRGVGVRGTAADLLDTSAGRVNLAGLLVQRRLHVQQLPSFMRLAPLLHEVPGLPGGAALRTAVAGLGGVTKVISRFRRS
jgi:uncharacterized protein (TIGR03083 family)